MIKVYGILFLMLFVSCQYMDICFSWYGYLQGRHLGKLWGAKMNSGVQRAVSLGGGRVKPQVRFQQSKKICKNWGKTGRFLTFASADWKGLLRPCLLLAFLAFMPSSLPPFSSPFLLLLLFSLLILSSFSLQMIGGQPPPCPPVVPPLVIYNLHLC